MTPTRPLPAAVTLFSELIAEKLLSKDLTPNPDGTVAVPDDEDDEPPPPHAARTVTAPTASTPSTRFFNILTSSGRAGMSMSGPSLRRGQQARRECRVRGSQRQRQGSEQLGAL